MMQQEIHGYGRSWLLFDKWSWGILNVVSRVRPHCWTVWFRFPSGFGFALLKNPEGHTKYFSERYGTNRVWIFGRFKVCMMRNFNERPAWAWSGRNG